MLVDGHDVMGALSLRPGPVVGELLALIDEARAVGQVDTREEAISLARSALESGSVGAGARPDRHGADR